MRYTIRRRSGFTLIELLVSISIIAVLMSLLLPAINSARESSRRLQCANRLRNLGVALHAYNDAQKRLPAAGYWGLPKDAPTPNRNWVVEILPWIDRSDIADRWDKSVSRLESPNKELSEFSLPVLVCPSDISAEGSRGNLSYAVNGGVGESDLIDGVNDCPVDPFHHLLDLNGDGVVCTDGIPDGNPSDRRILGQLGVFHTENTGFKGVPGYQGTLRHHSLDTIMDGASNTLLLTENVRVGYDPFADQPVNWSSPDTRVSRVFFSYRVCRTNSCGSGQVDYSLANSGDHAINAALTQPEGTAPWPSSFHSGGVNAIFADGHLSFINEDIDGRVYASLFSPQGRQLFRSPLDQGVIGSDF